jgi:RimJ/RimL family protein N-acetyltransferase
MDTNQTVGSPFLIGEKVFLRATEPSDNSLISELKNHPDPRKTLFYGIPANSSQIQEELNKLRDDQNTIVFTICKKVDDKPIGQAAFVRIDWLGRNGIFFLGLANKDNWSKGYGREVTELMLKYAFETLNFHRVELRVADENPAGMHIYQKAGFKHEGTQREAMFHEGHYVDFHIMGILKHEYNSPSKS